MRITRTLAILVVLMAAVVPQMRGQSASELLERGREAYLDYRFTEAARDYAAAYKKMKKGDTELLSSYREFNRELATAKNFLQRVEKIVIIDSIAVPRQEFFRHYRLPHSSGNLGNASALPYGREGVEYVFTNEGDDYKIWAEPDTTGRYHLMEALRLTDDSWGEPQAVGDTLSTGSDARYPFMMADGVTLYYSSNGENSIGGYDIMVATRDAADGEFLQPQNLGFPYNSPYDDYLLAIDELNNVGWWATERNGLEDEITVYVFIPNELRKNYSEEDDGDLTDFARISDYHATQDPEQDYSQLLSDISRIDPSEGAVKPDFILPMGKGRYYTRYSDFKSQTAAQMMKLYIKEKSALENAEGRLSDLRRQYASRRSASLKSQIMRGEQTVEQQRAKTAKALSDVYRAEKK